MPKELLELIRAINTLNDTEKAAEIAESISIRDFIRAVDEAYNRKEEADPAPVARKYNQQAGSYKVVSMNGTITALEIVSTDLVQVSKNKITLVWPHTGISFTTVPCDDDEYISQEVFNDLKAFVLQ